MLIELGRKILPALMAVGVAAGLLVNPAAASADESGGGCNDYYLSKNGQRTKMATLCRNWTPNGDGTYNGNYWATYYESSQIVAYANLDGEYKQVPRVGQSASYSRKRNVWLMACLGDRHTCAPDK